MNLFNRCCPGHWLWLCGCGAVYECVCARVCRCARIHEGWCIHRLKGFGKWGQVEPPGITVYTNFSIPSLCC